MVLRVYFLTIIHDKKRTPNIRQLESSIAISASCNWNRSPLKTSARNDDMMFTDDIHQP